MTLSDGDCVFHYSFTIEDYSIDLIVEEVINPGFANSYPGSIDITIISDKPYNVSWYTAEQGYPDDFITNSEDLEDVYADDYIVIVETEYCSVQRSFRLIACYTETKEGPIQNYNNIEVEESQILYVSSDQICDGSIDIDVISGGPGYFTWTGPNGYFYQGPSPTFLCKGEYCVTISNGCDEFEDCYVVGSCDDVQINISGTVVNTCPNVAYGSIDLNVSGGTTPYSFSWSNGSHTEDLMNIGVGTYTVTVTEAHGCIEIKSFVVIDNVEITVARGTQGLEKCIFKSYWG